MGTDGAVLIGAHRKGCTSKQKANTGGFVCVRTYVKSIIKEVFGIRLPDYAWHIHSFSTV
jgi:hypothetical protein